ncbi:unnamed protein product [Rhizopus stolonifer]
MNLPLVFRGKTPSNSASASLTTNHDRYFVPFRPEGSRSTWFKLAYEPNNEEKAVEEYQKWLTKLADHDWPFCFGVPKKKPEDEYQTPPASEADCDRLEPRKEASQEPVQTLSPESISTEKGEDKSLDTDKITEEKDKDQEEEKLKVPEEEKSPRTEDKDTSVNLPAENEDKTLEDLSEESKDLTTEIKKDEGSSTTKQNKNSLLSDETPIYTLDDLDLTDIPKCLDDIVYSAPSRIPGAGSGLFAKRKLPYNTPIGFYFGVPMTEDEFDSLKDRVGRASEYSIMYRRTVLDATDKEGEPVTDKLNPRYCPFHFMNEIDEQQTNVLFVEGIVVNQVICWTKREIEADEELLAWYGKDVNRHWDSK